ncbi:MAG: LPS export ABC transporter permease LptG [Rhodospirillaceae bacterium]|jgi:lipopolysaccharide export system permease protein|nr:LPS export ABC transporter permease LptG [Rhodospirillaceae bacterium]MBT6139475.1 LPS export ABC transporter permease LptG [Rhodospirillaceae bacterium]
MRLSGTLSAYFGRQFLFWVLGTFAAILAVVFLIDLIELLRRGANREAATFGLMIQLAALKLPNMGQTVFPYAVLFGGMLAFTRMTRSHELVVARAAGVSVWQFLLPALLIAILLGIAKVTIINPVASVLTARYERMENSILRNRGNLLAVSSGGLWLRERTKDGHSILHARGIGQDGVALSEVTVFLFDDKSAFAGRIDGRTATLEPGHWAIRDIVHSNRDGIPSAQSFFQLDTSLTIDNIYDSFASPETMSFWELPKFIAVLEDAGFTAVRHRLYWHSLLASPLMMAAMVLIAATFSLRPNRRGGVLLWVTAGLFFVFVLQVLSDVVFALGLSARVPEVLAAWTPASVAALLGAASLLHLEDG